MKIIGIFALLLITQLSCKKETFEDKILGSWDIVSLTINNHDTTGYVKGDSTYGYTNYFVDKDDNKSYSTIESLSGGARYFSIFGYWLIDGDSLVQRWIYSGIKPYVANEKVVWKINTINTENLSLYTVYNNMPCTLIYKRINK
jgi:hypothetical protein